MNQNRNQLVDESLLLTKECVAVADGAAKDATDHITGFGVARKLTVGYRESDGTQVVGNHAHGDVGLLVFTIHFARHVAQHLDNRLEHIGVIVRLFALKGTDQTLKAHAGVDHIHGKLFKAAVGFAVELHKHEVPNLNHQWMVFIYQVAARDGFLVCLVTGVKMNLRTRTARTGVAHLPKVVVLVAVDDMVGRNVLQPKFSGFVVALYILFWRTFKYCHVQVGWVQLQHINQIFPGHVNGAFFEIVAKRPVAQHLEHRVVVGVMTHFLQVVVLATHAQAFLSVGTAARLR